MANHINVRPSVSAINVKESIETALIRSADTEAKNIQVTVVNDVVTLQGKVDAWHARTVAQDAAWSAPSVRNVNDSLRVTI